MRRSISLLTLMMCTGMHIGSLEATLTPEFGVAEAVLGSKDTRFEPKLQLETLAEAGLTLVIGPITLGPFIGVHYAAASNLDGGYLYRGFRGWHWGGRIGVRFNPRERYLATSMGLRASGSVRYSRFQYTELIFFYPHVGISPYVDIRRDNSVWSIRILLPADLYFRRDLEYSLSVGIGVELVWDLIAAMERRLSLDEL